MLSLLVIKERLQSIYQKYDFVIIPIIKFIVAFVVFTIINDQTGYNAAFDKITIVLMLSLLSAFTPASVLVLLAAILATLHVYAALKLLTVVVVVIFFILYFLFIRFAPKQGYVVLAVPILYVLKIPYAVPILMGLISTPVSIIPVGCGVVIYYLFPIIKDAALPSATGSIEDTLKLFKVFVDTLINNKEMLVTIAIFSLIIVITYVIRKMSFDYAFEIAVGVGIISNILLFLIVDLTMDISGQILSMILGTIGSGIVVYIIQFFRRCLDYSAVERVQFEDDDYYYYVKAVPKASVTSPERNVKRINPKIFRFDDEDEDEFE